LSIFLFFALHSNWLSLCTCIICRDRVIWYYCWNRYWFLSFNYRCIALLYSFLQRLKFLLWQLSVLVFCCLLLRMVSYAMCHSKYFEVRSFKAILEFWIYDMVIKQLNEREIFSIQEAKLYVKFFFLNKRLWSRCRTFYFSTFTEVVEKIYFLCWFVK